ncbi:hypothetical protein PYCCODRAFT_283151 [Trametes coccinea BRFM310]|uniref:Uncharacterized protein n=1 Tax=Trametes coccinea (strain BRFM310) TaxID=1353009 RepID=A0A1Y2ISV4_TRAC3|nr:hypothetical protein PYCCODRAFT_283151 [Trametes coccinea BRFM310]
MHGLYRAACPVVRAVARNLRVGTMDIISLRGEACSCPDSLPPESVCALCPPENTARRRRRCVGQAQAQAQPAPRLRANAVRDEAFGGHYGSVGEPELCGRGRAVRFPGPARLRPPLEGLRTHGRTDARAGFLVVLWCPFICESLFAFRTRPLRTRAPSRTVAPLSPPSLEANSVSGACWFVGPRLLLSVVIPVVRATLVCTRRVV